MNYVDQEEEESNHNHLNQTTAVAMMECEEHCTLVEATTRREDNGGSKPNDSDEKNSNAAPQSESNHLEQLSKVWDKVQEQTKQSCEQRCSPLPPPATPVAASAISASPIARGGSSRNETPVERDTSRPYASLDRWSTSNIDATSSLPQLNSIRHRLKTLLEHVEGKIENELVKKALEDYELGVGQSY